MKHHVKHHMDRLGITLSILCCIHCLATPIVLMFAPWMASVLESEVFHLVMLLAVAPLAIWALFSRLKIHGDRKPMALGSVGLALLAIGVLFHEVGGHEHHHDMEIYLTVLGGVVLAVAHIWNIRLCECHRCTEEHHVCSGDHTEA